MFGFRPPLRSGVLFLVQFPGGGEEFAAMGAVVTSGGFGGFRVFENHFYDLCLDFIFFDELFHGRPFPDNGLEHVLS
tara:strand:- start:389 stop:619 length:231 start_codon:yes stop_codon:yes gene_type:complete